MSEYNTKYIFTFLAIALSFYLIITWYSDKKNEVGRYELITSGNILYKFDSKNGDVQFYDSRAGTWRKQ